MKKNTSPRPVCNGWEMIVLDVLRELSPGPGIDFPVRVRTLTGRTGLPVNLVAFTILQLVESGKISCQFDRTRKRRLRSWLVRIL